MSDYVKGYITGWVVGVTAVILGCLLASIKL
jgi:hypothetical protein